MYGAVIGDIIGSTFEFREVKKKEIPLFAWGSDYTDDTILTIAVARALLQWKAEGGDLHRAMCSQMRELGRKYPSPLGSYGIRFSKWLHSSNPTPYNSCGNGSAMRVSPCGLMAGSLEEALELAKISAEVTHNHPEGIKGAQAVAAPSSWPGPAAQRRKSGNTSRPISIPWTGRWRKYARITALTAPARAAFPNPSSRSWSRKASRTRSGIPSPSGETRIPWAQ